MNDKIEASNTRLRAGRRRLVSWAPKRRSSGVIRQSLRISVVLSLIAETLLAANWYVDKDATGANNGTSWANAWTSPANIAWASVQPGDTIFFSGGATEKVYTNAWTVGKSGSQGAPITFRPGQDPGHNGKVIFDYGWAGETAALDGINFVGRNYLHFNGNVNGERHWVIRNLVNYFQRTWCAAFVSYGSSNNHLRGNIFEYIEFDNVNNAIRTWNYVTNFTVRYCRLTNIRGDCAIAFLHGWDAFDVNIVHDNYIELAFNTTPPPGRSGYAGPDGIQGGGSITAYNNVFKVVPVNYYTSDQHPDTFQIPGNYTKIYNNEFINVGDCAVSLHSWGTGEQRRDLYIYNNVFRIVNAADNLPEFIRMFQNKSPFVSVDNLKILNNTFIDNTAWVNITLSWGSGGNPTGTGNEIRNNIFYNCGSGIPRPVWRIVDSSNFTANSWTISHNVYYHPANNAYVYFRGTDYTAANWVASNEPTGTTSAPQFVQYTPNGANNDLHLALSDTVARDTGFDLSSYFKTDKLGAARGPLWDRGAFEVTPTMRPPAPAALRVSGSSPAP